MRTWIAPVFLVLCHTLRSTAVAPNPMTGCCHGQRFIVALDGEDEHPFFDFKTHPVAFNTTLAREETRGFVPDILFDLVDVMGADLHFYALDPGLPLDARQEEVERLLEDGIVDAVFNSGGLGAESFGHERLGGEYAFTTAVYKSPVGGVVKLNGNYADLWAFFKPFSWELWGGLAAVTAVVGLVLLTMKGLETVEEGASLSQALRQMFGVMTLENYFSTLYTTLTVYLGEDSYEWPSSPEKILRSGWLFFCLIMVASYTANLASFFIQPRFNVHTPPTNMADLHLATACTTATTASELGSPLQTYVKSFIHPPFECKPWSQCATDFCYNAVQDGTVDVWLDDLDALHGYVIENSLCSTLMEVQEVSLMPFFNSAYFQLDHSNWQFAGNLSAALVYENNSPRYIQLMDKYYFTHAQCDRNNGDLTLSFANMKGLFYVTGGVVIVALLFALFCLLRRAAPAAVG
eukprot:CAMPEP_0118922738 /NCGR_PEP_ID=MMETSP1169-20130426/1565_1 /TAXON_ID=36882 /ORGANISM="Pyramimonas obovata, Strain CCMP722" /LENGTH=462 /DNA_ID=CAMNT_0006863659 /DNA_START=1 /DNA_END=1385 /DNA_ORIENTATION=+